MNHPHELLANLMDGTLDEGDLAGVQTHLDACTSCREDFAHATAGREAARSLPQAVAPGDLHQRIVAAAGGRGRGVPGQGVPAWYRWAGVAAAAAVVVAIAIALPDVGGGGTERGAAPEDATGGAEMSPPDSVGVLATDDVATSVQDRDYSEEGLQRLANASRSDALSSGQEAATREIVDPEAAVRCVAQAAQDRTIGRLTRLIQARFEGRDAYIAVYLEGPGADQRPDLVALWVAARDNCSLLSLAFSRI